MPAPEVTRAERKSMKVIQRYQCEVCHTEYTDKKKAEACEKSHRQPAKIVGARYLSMAQNGPGYPVSVTLKMSDGNEVTYKR